MKGDLESGLPSTGEHPFKVSKVVPERISTKVDSSDKRIAILVQINGDFDILDGLLDIPGSINRNQSRITERMTST